MSNQYTLRIEPWPVYDGLRLVAACPTREASEAAARLLGVTPPRAMSDSDQKRAALEVIERAVDDAVRKMYERAVAADYQTRVLE